LRQREEKKKTFMIKIIIGLAKKATRNFLVVFALKISTY
jgi:hypothetical protein